MSCSVRSGTSHHIIRRRACPCLHSPKSIATGTVMSVDIRLSIPNWEGESKKIKNNKQMETAMSEPKRHHSEYFSKGIAPRGWRQNGSTNSDSNIVYGEVLETHKMRMA